MNSRESSMSMTAVCSQPSGGEFPPLVAAGFTGSGFFSVDGVGAALVEVGAAGTDGFAAGALAPTEVDAAAGFGVASDCVGVSQYEYPSTPVVSRSARGIINRRVNWLPPSKPDRLTFHCGLLSRSRGCRSFRLLRRLHLWRSICR